MCLDLGGGIFPKTCPRKPSVTPTPDCLGNYCCALSAVSLRFLYVTAASRAPTSNATGGNRLGEPPWLLRTAAALSLDSFLVDCQTPV